METEQILIKFNQIIQYFIHFKVSPSDSDGKAFNSLELNWINHFELNLFILTIQFQLNKLQKSIIFIYKLPNPIITIEINKFQQLLIDL